MEEYKVVQRNLALQRQWYGEPLGDRVRRLVVTFRVSQAQLADTLGISAPMLSQVMSGRRAKIGNPSVLARLVLLERKAQTPGMSTADSVTVRRVLDEVRDSRPSFGQDTALALHPGREQDTVCSALRQRARPSELESAAGLLDATHPTLADLLRRAATVTE